MRLLYRRSFGQATITGRSWYQLAVGKLAGIGSKKLAIECKKGLGGYLFATILIHTGFEDASCDGRIDGAWALGDRSKFER